MTENPPTSKVFIGYEISRIISAIFLFMYGKIELQFVKRAEFITIVVEPVSRTISTYSYLVYCWMLVFLPLFLHYFWDFHRISQTNVLNKYLRSPVRARKKIMPDLWLSRVRLKTTSWHDANVGAAKAHGRQDWGCDRSYFEGMKLARLEGYGDTIERICEHN